MQKFTTQPSNDGQYEICRWNEMEEKWQPIRAEKYPTEEIAKERAAELNKYHAEDVKQNV